jgi:DNA-binding HxlR family transcriptional regulator
VTATDEEPHPSTALDEVVHQRVRLGILALLRTGATMPFTSLRDQLQLSDGNLNRHLHVLQEADLVTTRRQTGGRAPRTTVTITPAGRVAIDAQFAALRKLIGDTD